MPEVQHVGDKPTPAVEAPLNDTEKMHKQSLDQVNYFKKINKEERERKIAEGKKKAEELEALRAKKARADLPHEQVESHEV